MCLIHIISYQVIITSLGLEAMTKSSTFLQQQKIMMIWIDFISSSGKCITAVIYIYLQAYLSMIVRVLHIVYRYSLQQSHFKKIVMKYFKWRLTFVEMYIFFSNAIRHMEIMGVVSILLRCKPHMMHQCGTMYIQEDCWPCF